VATLSTVRRDRALHPAGARGRFGDLPQSSAHSFMMIAQSRSHCNGIYVNFGSGTLTGTTIQYNSADDGVASMNPAPP